MPVQRAGCIAVLSDIHFPYHDPIALLAAEEVLQVYRPQHIFLNGDILDFEEVSFYDKDPHRTKPLQDEIDEARGWLAQLRRQHPSATITYLQGNHEDRLRRWLMKHQGLASLRAVKLESLLGLNELKMRCIPYDKGLIHEDVLIRHGKRCGLGAGLKNLRDSMMSGTSGHTHKLTYDAVTTPRGPLHWVQSGCLCQMDMPYWTQPPSQQHGMVLGWRIHGTMRLKPVPIYDGEVML